MSEAPLTQRCIYCARDYPLRFFRRWSNGKSRLMTSCNGCSPPKTLKQMTPYERERALLTSHRAYHPVYVQEMNRREREHFKNSVMPDIQYRRRAEQRKENWTRAILGQAQVEYEWAKAALIRYRKEVSTGNAQRTPYVEFFSEYVRVLKQMLQVIRAKANTRGAAITPTVEEINPRSYLTDTQYLKLKTLFSDCTPIPGTRAARDPWLMFWQSETDATASV